MRGREEKNKWTNCGTELNDREYAEDDRKSC
jgi:hypothetical protein